MNKDYFDVPTNWDETSDSNLKQIGLEREIRELIPDILEKIREKYPISTFIMSKTVFIRCYKKDYEGIRNQIFSLLKPDREMSKQEFEKYLDERFE